MRGGRIGRTIAAGALLIASASTTSLAGELPKQGDISVTFAMQGSFKALEIGPDAYAWSSKSRISTINNYGTDVLHNMSGDCVSLGSGEQSSGYCSFADEDGNQIFEHWEAVADKGSGTLLGGTGKFAGIAGRLTWTWIELPAPDGSFQGTGQIVGTYELP